MGARKLRDGRWAVAYRDRENGKVTWEYFGRGYNAELRARSRAEELKIREYVRRTPRQTSVRLVDLVNAYSEAKVSSVAETTISNFLCKMHGVILPELGHLQVMRITAKRIDQYVAKRLRTQVTKRVIRRGRVHRIPLMNSDGTRRTVKRATVHRELSDIQAVLNWASDPERGYIPRNPVARYRKPNRDDEIILPPNPEEIRRILAHASDHLVRALTLSYYTGLRPGAVELFSLRWTDIDFEAETILVRSARKGGLTRRSVPLAQQFVRQLKLWRDEDNNQDGPIIHFNGQPIKQLRRSFRTAKKKAGITRRLRPYDFRHAFATMALRSGSDLKATSQILGHSRTETTTRIYQHVDTAMHRAVIQNIPSILDPETPD